MIFHSRSLCCNYNLSCGCAWKLLAPILETLLLIFIKSELISFIVFPCSPQKGDRLGRTPPSQRPRLTKRPRTLALLALLRPCPFLKAFPKGANDDYSYFPTLDLLSSSS